MGTFILTLLGWTAGVIAAVAAIRYGLLLAGYLDPKLSALLQSSWPGFNWYWKLPYRAGLVTEFFFSILTGKRNYFKPNWWPLKLTGYLAFLLFLALLFSRSGTLHYLRNLWYNGILFPPAGELTFLTVYLITVTLLLAGVMLLLTAESVRMHYFLFPVRLLLYSCLSILFGLLSLLTLVVLMIYPLLYLVSRITGANPFASLSENYVRFRETLTLWQEKRRFAREHKQKTIARPVKIPRRPGKHGGQEAV